MKNIIHKKITFLEMIEKEINDIKKNPDLMNSIPFIREDAAAIMLCCVFRDGRIHYIFPHRNIVLRIVNDIVHIIKNNGWKKSQELFEKQKMKPFIDNKDFEL
jgi:hypothetical protein